MISRVNVFLLVFINLLSNGSLVTSQTFNVVTIAGNGASAFLDGKGTLASFSGPRAVAVDNANNVYVADHNNHRLRKITPGKDVTLLAGGGSTPASSPSSCLTSSFNYPEGINFDSHINLYIADMHNGLVRKITPACSVSAIASGLSYPWGIAVDSKNFIFVTERGTDLIKKITPQGVMSTWAGQSGGFSAPMRLAVDSLGNIYVSEWLGNQVKKIDLNSAVTVFAGKTTSGYSDGQGISATFSQPWGLTTDAQGNVYLADSSNHRIRHITFSGYVSTIAGSGNAVYLDGVGTSAGFNSPTDVAFDLDGNMIVSEGGGQRIRKMVICYSPSIFSSNLEACSCNAGYQYLNKTCTQCPLSYFQAAASNMPCSRCPNGTESNTLKTGCSDCPLGKYRNSAMSQCEYCSIGYEPSADRSTCYPCPSGKYRPDNSTGTCLTCPDSATCNSTNIIKCKLGYRNNVTSCIQCQVGTEQSPDGISCITCMTGYSRPLLSIDSCAKCQSEGSLSCNSTSIQCANGYYFDTLTVAECRRNHSVSLDAKTVSSTLVSTSVVIYSVSVTQSVTAQINPVTETVTNSITIAHYQTAAITTTVVSTTSAIITTTVVSTASAVITATISSVIRCPTVTTPSTIQTVLTLTPTSCPPGYTLDESKLICIKCPIGHVKFSSDISECFKCSVGKEPNSDQTECKNCPPGKYKPSEEYFICVDEPQREVGSSNVDSATVTVAFIGTLPISPLLFGIATFGLGMFLMLMLSLLFCRRKVSASRKRDEEFDGGISNTYGNTTSQRTFTNTISTVR